MSPLLIVGATVYAMLGLITAVGMYVTFRDRPVGRLISAFAAIVYGALWPVVVLVAVLEATLLKPTEPKP